MINLSRFVQKFLEETLRVKTLRVNLQPGVTSRDAALDGSEDLVLPERIEIGEIVAQSRP